MDLFTLLLLAVVGLTAGTMNAVAGGGSFVTFPALIGIGMPAISANASSTVALLPGSIASAWTYRHDYQSFPGVTDRLLLIIALTGGLFGAVLLLVTPSDFFTAMVPWLLLVASLTFAFGPQASRHLKKFVTINPTTLIVTQILLSIYSGYFGGGVGIMMMASWSLFGLTNLRAMNAAKTLLVGSTNLMASGYFIAVGLISWPQTLIMLVMALVGGYGGARVVQIMNVVYLRRAIMILNFVITGLMFRKIYF